MPDDNTRDDAESAESANQIFARELCDAAVLHAAKFAGAEMLMHWRVNRALREKLVAELDARDAALRDAREEVESLQSDAANDAGRAQSYKRAIDELCNVLGIDRGNDNWPEFIARLRERSATKDAVVAAARRVVDEYEEDVPMRSMPPLRKALAHLDAAGEES